MITSDPIKKIGKKRRNGFSSVSFPAIPDAPATRDAAIYFGLGLCCDMSHGHASQKRTADALLGGLSMLLRLNTLFGGKLLVQDILFLMYSPPNNDKMSRYYYLSRFCDDLSKDQFDAYTVISFSSFFHGSLRPVYGQSGKELVKKIYASSLGVNITSMIASAKRSDKRKEKGLDDNLAKFAPVVSCAICDADLSNKSEVKNKCLKICRFYE